MKTRVPAWAVAIEVEFVSELLSEQLIADLLARDTLGIKQCRYTVVPSKEDVR